MTMVALQKQSPPRNAQPTSLTSNGNSTNPSTNPHKDTIEEAGPFQNAPIGSHSKWKLRMRPDDDGEAQVWWFASTAIPLLAATTGPLANVMSIAALITKWRANYDPDFPGIDSHSVGYADPRWCIALNVASLVCGFVGNVFLLFNFTRRVRCKSAINFANVACPDSRLDIIALPMTIILWYFATGIVSLISLMFIIHVVFMFDYMVMVIVDLVSHSPFKTVARLILLYFHL